METETLAVRFLGIALILLIVGFVLCFLAIVGYNTYVKFKDKNKKIEVSAKKSTNSKQNDFE